MVHLVKALPLLPEEGDLLVDELLLRQLSRHQLLYQDRLRRLVVAVCPIELLQLGDPVGGVGGDGLQRGDEVGDVLSLGLVVGVYLAQKGVFELNTRCKMMLIFRLTKKLLTSCPWVNTLYNLESKYTCAFMKSGSPFWYCWRRRRCPLRSSTWRRHRRRRSKWRCDDPEERFYCITIPSKKRPMHTTRVLTTCGICLIIKRFGIGIQTDDKMSASFRA